MVLFFFSILQIGGHYFRHTLYLCLATADEYVVGFNKKALIKMFTSPNRKPGASPPPACKQPDNLNNVDDRLTILVGGGIGSFVNEKVWERTGGYKNQIYNRKVSELLKVRRRGIHLKHNGGGRGVAGKRSDTAQGAGGKPTPDHTVAVSRSDVLEGGDSPPGNPSIGSVIITLFFQLETAK